MRVAVFFLSLACAGLTLGADDRLVFADGLLRRGMHAQAAAEYEAVLKTPPTGEEAADIRLRLAECYERLGRSDEAQTLYKAVIAGAEGDRRIAVELLLADSLLKAGRAKEAQPLLETLATGKAPEALRDVASYRLGMCYEALGRGQDASTLYRILSDKGGEHALHARLALAALTGREGRHAEAAALYREALKTAEPDRRANVAVAAFGQAYAAKDSAAAAEFARTAGERKLGEAKLLLPAAWAAVQAGRPEEARAWLAADRTAEPNPTAERLTLEGAVADALGDTPGALTAYERVLSEFPESVQAKTAAESMLALRAKAGDPAAFLKAYARVAARLDREAVAAMAPVRLDAALQVKDAAEAKAAAAWIVANAPAAQAAEASYRLAWLAQQEKDWAKAGEAWLRTAETWPAEPCAGRAAYAAAYAFGKAKLPDRAAHALRLALASGDTAVIPDALMLRARAELAEHDTASAAATLDEYLTRFPQGTAAAEAAYLRGLIFFNAQDFKAAEARLGIALAREQQGPTPLDHTRRTDAALRRAQSLHALGRGDEAAALLQPLLGLKDADTLSPAYLRWLAEFRLGRKEWPEAETAARALTARAEATPADRVLAHLLLGRAAEGQGQIATAMAAYEAALASSPEPTAHDAEAALGLGSLRAAEGSHAKAREAFTLAVDRANVSESEGRTVRARATAGLAAACNALGLKDEALRADMSLIIFFDDAELVPAAFRDAIAILESQGRTDEAKTLKVELKQRYGKEQ